jgi:two-component system CheB/CheR fusion protein
VTRGTGVTPESPLYLVTLEESPVLDPAAAALPAAGAADTEVKDADARIAALTEELRAKDEYLQSTREELETANEELKSSNEEMQSVNEELQSTNEELETSKEELQSVNEELATVNAELHTKVLDLSRANNDMNNLLAGTGIGTVFVDHCLRILRFTPSAPADHQPDPGDVGRAVGHIVSNLVGYDRLVADVQGVLEYPDPQGGGRPQTAGKWYTMRIQPYRTLDNVIEGAVISFVDITETVRHGSLRAWRMNNRRCAWRWSCAMPRCHHRARPGGPHPRLESGSGTDLRLERSRGAADERARPHPAGAARRRPGHAAGICRDRIPEPYHTQRLTKAGRSWMCR